MLTPYSLLSMLLFQMETSAHNTYESLETVLDYQTHHKMRETQGRAHAEALNERVLYWSMGQTIVILVVGIGQVLVLRSFFTERRTKPWSMWLLVVRQFGISLCKFFGDYYHVKKLCWNLGQYLGGMLGWKMRENRALCNSKVKTSGVVCWI